MRSKLVLSLALIAAFAIAAPAASARTYFPDCNDGYKAKYKPRKIQACVGILRQVQRLKWSSWGTKRASARGSYIYQTCEPTCVEGKTKRLKARVVLYRKRRCPSTGKNVFTRMKFLAKGESSSPAKLRCRPF